MKKQLIFAVISAAILGLGVWRYVTLNNRYPAPTTKEYRCSDTVEYGGITLSATGHYFVDSNEAQTLFSDEYEAGHRPQCVVVELKLTNLSQEQRQIALYPFILESQTWKNGIHLQAFMEMDSFLSTPTLNPTLEPGQTLSLKLPFVMIKDQFSSKAWTSVKSRDYRLVLSLYPTKTVVCV